MQRDLTVAEELGLEAWPQCPPAPLRQFLGNVAGIHSPRVADNQSVNPRRPVTSPTKAGQQHYQFARYGQYDNVP